MAIKIKRMLKEKDYCIYETFLHRLNGNNSKKQMNKNRQTKTELSHIT